MLFTLCAVPRDSLRCRHGLFIFGKTTLYVDELQICVVVPFKSIPFEFVSVFSFWFVQEWSLLMLDCWMLVSRLQYRFRLLPKDLNPSNRRTFAYNSSSSSISGVREWILSSWETTLKAYRLLSPAVGRLNFYSRCSVMHNHMLSHLPILLFMNIMIIDWSSVSCLPVCLAVCMSMCLIPISNKLGGLNQTDSKVLNARYMMIHEWLDLLHRKQVTWTASVCVFEIKRIDWQHHTIGIGCLCVVGWTIYDFRLRTEEKTPQTTKLMRWFAHVRTLIFLLLDI